MLRGAVKQLQAARAPRDLVARGIERAAAWPAAEADSVARAGRRRLLAAISAAAAIVILAVGAVVVSWIVSNAPVDEMPQATAPPAPASPPGSDLQEACRPPAKMDPFVKVVRLPQGASHPQAVTCRGELHLVYFLGDPGGGDVFYVRSTQPDGVDFSRAVRVNSHPGSASVADPGSGVQLMADRATGQVDVVWSGPAGPGRGGDGPVYYARLLPKASSFEPQRNLGAKSGGRGPAIAAHVSLVCVFWHAPAPEKQDGNRMVWLAKSLDGGKTFAKPKTVSPKEISVCPNCPLCATDTNPGMPVVVYRGATDPAHRDTYLLYEGFWEKPRSEAGWFNDKFHNVKLHAWKTSTCPATTAAVLEVHNGYLAAWETEGQIYFSRIPGCTGKFAPPVAAPGKGGRRKHPALGFNGRYTALAWIETAGKECSVCWQLFDHLDQPGLERSEAHGALPGSRPAVVPTQWDRFLVIY
jgi:hypothetical protein